MTSKLADRDKEVRVWIERYEQVMMDLHASQFRLVQLARGVSWVLLTTSQSTS